MIVRDGRKHVRHYYDYLGLNCGGRHRDALLYILGDLKKRGALGADRFVIWSDSGTGDFHNAPGVYAFSRLAEHWKDEILLESLNFFAARHGWNDVDRHFGAIVKARNRWYTDEAKTNQSLTFDVPQLMRMLQGPRMSNTTPLNCWGEDVSGVVCPSVHHLIDYYSYQPVSSHHDSDARYIAAFVYSSEAEGTLFLLNGSLISHKAAVDLAKGRKSKKTASPAKPKGKSSKKKKKK